MSTAGTPPDATQVILRGGAVPGRLAQYEMLRQIGSGAMGAVYLARDVDLDRQVAIKLLHVTETNPAAREGAEERLLREARSAAQLSHPHVAVVYQVGRAGGQTFIAMEWIDGGDLGQRVARGALPWREATAAVRDAAAGLAAAHARGLVHRDVKPSNLMRSGAGGAVKLVDFGLARLHAVASDLTVSGSIVGSPAYLAPEVFRGDVAGPAADLYALGCTYHHLLTGSVPFPGAHWVAVMNQHVSAPMPDPRQAVPGLPDAVARIVLRATAKEPAQRYPDAAAMCDELQALLDADGAAAAPGDAGAAPDPTVGATAAAATAPADAATSEAAAADVPLTLADPSRGAASVAVPHGNLPAAIGAFVGREAIADSLAARLGEERLVTLTGPGGTGKTRLSQHVARRLAPGYADGVWLVELAALPPGGDAALAAAAVFGVRENAQQGIDAALVEMLRAQRLLLLLDNCEHVLDSAARLAARIVAGCPGVVLLATSRQPLALPGESVLPVPPLALAAPGATVQQLLGVESVRLFVQRARAARPEFALSLANAEAVAQVCRRLDGLPLAIELAAARIKVLSVQQIAARLDDAFRLLASNQRTLDPRQQTLRALIDWSWQLLDAAERLALARASVFAGEFSLEAAEAVLAAPDDGAAAVDVLDVLAGLVDKSLVVAQERGGAVRYALLQTIRQYAATRLDADERAAAEARHAAHYAALVAAIRQRFDTAEHAAAEAQMALEHEQARAALASACAGRRLDVALPLAEALAQYWYLAGPLADGMQRVAGVLALDPPAGAGTALLLRRGAALAIRCGALDTARGWLEQGLAMARESGPPATVGGILNTLGNLAYTQGHFEAAQQHYAEALAIFRDGGQRENAVSATSNLAGIQRRLGRLAEARQHYLAALALLRGSSNNRRIGHLKLNLGELEAVDGRPEVALPLLAECIAALQPLGENWGVGLAHMVLGGCALAGGDMARADAETGTALELLRRDGDPSSIAFALDQAARIALVKHQPEDAARLAGEALALRLAANNLPDIAASLNTWAALVAQAHPQQAARLLGCAGAVRLAQHAPLDPPLARDEQALLDALSRRLGRAALERALADGAAADLTALARALVDAPC